MPLFDESAPADGTVAGLIAKVVRDDIKKVFNDEFEAKVVTVIDDKWECVQGWPRVYFAVAASPPSPPANADEGCIWFVSDEGRLKVHNGTAWVYVDVASPYLATLALTMGVPHRTNTSSWADAALVYADAATDTLVAKGWLSGKGYPFNKASVPTGATIKLRAVAGSDGANYDLRLYDVAAAGAITGSTIQFTGGGGTNAETVVSGDLTSAIASGDRVFRLQNQYTGGVGYGYLYAAELVVERT